VSPTILSILTFMPTEDDTFCDYVADRLAGLPGVQAVSLGGSRAAGNHRADSDWDFAVYYRGAFTPDSIRSLGWQGLRGHLPRPSRARLRSPRQEDGGMTRR